MTGLWTQPVMRNDRLAALGIEAIPSSTSEVIAATAEDAWVRNPTTSLLREIRRQAETGHEGIGAEFGAEGLGPSTTRSRILPKDIANEIYGVSGELSFDGDTPEAVAIEKHNLKRQELERRQVFARSQGGVGETAAQLAAGVVVSAADPLNLASAFIPVVGPTRSALWLARAGTSPAGRALARARIGAIEGAAGAAVLEPIVYGVAQQEQADYGMADTLLNLTFGTVLGGGLHVVGGAISDRVGRLPLEARERGMRATVAELAERGQVNQAAAEADQLGRAYDQVHRASQGPADEPLVMLRPEELEAVVVERGGWKGVGDVTVQGRGWGLAKIIWRHGEESGHPPAMRVMRDDVLALPEILREYQPRIENPNASTFFREWRVLRPGPDGQPRQLVYTASRFTEGDGQSRLVTIHVQRPGERNAAYPLSQKRTGRPGSPSAAVNRLGDTGQAPFGRAPGGRDAPAGRSLSEAEKEFDRLFHQAAGRAPATGLWGLPPMRDWTPGAKILPGERAVLEGLAAEVEGAAPVTKIFTPLDERDPARFQGRGLDYSGPVTVLPSERPAWFQQLQADEGIGPQQLRPVVEKLLAGKDLKKRERRLAEAMMHRVREIRAEQAKAMLDFRAAREAESLASADAIAAREEQFWNGTAEDLEIARAAERATAEPVQPLDARVAAALEEANQDLAQLKAAGLVDDSAPELQAVKELEAQASALGKAFEAGAFCMSRSS